MTKDFSVIPEIERVRDKISKLAKLEKELSEPKLYDLDLIPTLYEWFRELSLIGEKRARRVRDEEFIFIVLFLYSPSSLAGGKMRSGLREKISGVIGMNKSSVSRKATPTVYQYRIYKYFRRDIDRIYEGIVERLENNKTTG